MSVLLNLKIITKDYVPMGYLKVDVLATLMHPG